MAAKNVFAKRAESLLNRRVETVTNLGELLELHDRKHAELDDLDEQIGKATTECVAAGWTTAELIEMGIPKVAKPRRRRATRPAADAGAGHEQTAS
jgi:hypothetical protein